MTRHFKREAIVMGLPLLGVVVIGLLAGFIAPRFFGKIGSLCNNVEVSDVVSPDGKLHALIFERDCGATSGFSTQVSVLPIEEKSTSVAGNVTSADSNHGAAPAVPGGGPVVLARWSSASDLVIRHDPKARVFFANPSVGNVRVSYEGAVR